MNRVADEIAATFWAHGIRRAFGMPGGEVVTLIDGLVRQGIAFHLARHETAAALMAAGSSVVERGPGLLVTTVGPGLANAVNGIADAAQEHVPLIVISGIVDRPTRARYTHQVIDHAALLRPLVKASFEIEAESAGATVARAIALAMTEPRGPVHLDLSPATAAMKGGAGPADAPPHVDVPEISPTDPAIARLRARFAAARRPIILAGYEAACSGADITGLAEVLGVPVITTYKAKGVISESHPLALGGAGLSPKADRILLSLLGSADLILMIGYDPIEMRLGWMDPTSRIDEVIDITAAPADHAMHRVGWRLAGDCSGWVRALIRSLRDAPVTGQRWPTGEPSATRAQLDLAFADRDGFGPHAIVRALRRHAGPDAVVTVDSGAHRILLSQIWSAERPLTLLQSAGFCTMAAALPMAIGAKLSAPGKRVFAVMGDGGLEMGIGELASLRDSGLPITIVVFQDASLALIAKKQADMGLSRAAVSLGLSDFARIAEGFGGWGRTVTSLEELDEELSAAETRTEFSLIACRFDENAYENAF